jgi:nucleotide-binding universal stress UspA family protein
MFQRILVTWDGSGPAKRAFNLAVALARSYDAEIVAASVAHSPAHAETEDDRVESVNAARQYFESTFAKARDRADRIGVPVEHVILEGDHPSEDLLAYAHSHGFDLVVVGHHHNRRAGRFFLHGLAERLASGASLPVMIVPTGSEE